MAFVQQLFTGVTFCTATHNDITHTHPVPCLHAQVLVLDKHSMRIVSSCCRMFDIIDEGITRTLSANPLRP